MIPLGWCGCGCGHQTSIAKKTRGERGWIKGQPLRYISNHHDPLGLVARGLQKIKTPSAAASTSPEVPAPARTMPTPPSATVSPSTLTPLIAPAGALLGRGVRFIEPWEEKTGRASLLRVRREHQSRSGHGYGSPARSAYRP